MQLDIWTILFYGIIILCGITFVALTIYRIDWARHPEKYKDMVEDAEKEEYRRKKEAEKKAAAQKAKEKEKEREKQRKRQKRVEKLNHYRAINGKDPVGMDGKTPVDKKRKK